MGAAGSRERAGAAAVAAGAAAALLYVASRPRRRHPSEPPLEAGWIPFLGVGIAFSTDFGGLMDRLRAKHGSIFTVVNFGQRMTFVTDVRSMRKLWTMERQFSFDDFGSQAEARLSGLETVEQMKARGGGSTVLAVHAREMRGPENIEALAVRFREALGAATEALPFLRGGQQWATIDLREFTGVLVWYAAGRSLFGRTWLQGVDPVESYRRYQEFDAAVPLIVGGLPPWATKKGCEARDFLVREILTPTAARCGDDAHPYMSRYIATFRQNYAHIPNGDLLLGGRLTGILVAVMSNTMHAAFWTLARLLSIPDDHRQSIQAEVARATERSNSYAECRHMMPSLSSLIIETMRLHGDPSSFRIAQEDVVVQGLGADGTREVAFRKGDSVFMLSTYEQLKGVEGDREAFQAKRWEESAKDDKLGANFLPIPPDQVLLTFGGGKHLCPGRFFAMLEMYLAIAFCVERYEFELVGGELPRKVVDLGAQLNQPKESFQVRFQQRHSSI